MSCIAAQLLECVQCPGFKYDCLECVVLCFVSLMKTRYGIVHYIMTLNIWVCEVIFQSRGKQIIKGFKNAYSIDKSITHCQKIFIKCSLTTSFLANLHTLTTVHSSSSKLFLPQDKVNDNTHYTFGPTPATIAPWWSFCHLAHCKNWSTEYCYWQNIVIDQHKLKYV